MLNKIKYLVILACLTGCVAANVDSQYNLKIPTGQQRLTNIEYVKVGMSKAEVNGVMGDHIVIGYKEIGDLLASFEPIKLEHPYRKEEYQLNEEMYEIFYYYTNVNKADEKITDDELTPLVFKKDELVGKGWDYLFELKKN